MYILSLSCVVAGGFQFPEPCHSHNLQVLRVHAGKPSSAYTSQQETPEAFLAALSCVHSFMSSTMGIEAAFRSGGAIIRVLCAALTWQDADTSQMVLEMLCNLCVYSATGYRLALKVGCLIEY